MDSQSKMMPWLVGALMGLALGLVVLLILVVLRQDVSPPPEEEPVVEQVEVEPPADVRVTEATAVEAEESIDDTVHRERSNAIVQATQRVSAVVVSINTLRTGPPPTRGSELLYYLRHGPRRMVGLGSGILVDHRGYVLTAYHVVAGSERLNVTLSTGDTFAASVIGISPEYDLAMVRIQGEVSGLPTASFGDSDTLRNGEWVIAIGSPFGHLISDNNPTVTVGVVSAVHRDVRVGSEGRTVFDMIQTDAAINPGNSGGPLVNAHGEVVGINTAVISDASGKSTGLGFAVPINRARWVMEELREYGRVRPHTMGINGYLITERAREQMLLNDRVPDGWLVESIVQGSPGAETGIMPRDVITHVDGTPLTDASDHARLFYEARVGQTVELRVWRDGETFDVDVTLAERTGS